MRAAMAPSPPHIPVLLDPLIAAVTPVAGVWLDGTFGAGGYASALLAAGAERVIGLDRDPTALAMAKAQAGLSLVEARFSTLDQVAAELGAAPLAGVVLDIGVSSMQLDQAERGFSFLRDGPLDMRMGAGLSAADIVNDWPEATLADVLFRYGEERASRRIARAINARRQARPFVGTLDLAAVIETALPPARPGQPHPATRSFQALRIAVNQELDELAAGLMAAERALAPGGVLAVVTFHSLEDRIVKRFLRSRGGAAPRGSRHQPAAGLPAEAEALPGFEIVTRRAIAPSAAEIDVNPRARSAKLRIARRTGAPAQSVEPAALGVPTPPMPNRPKGGRSR